MWLSKILTQFVMNEAIGLRKLVVIDIIIIIAECFMKIEAR